MYRGWNWTFFYLELDKLEQIHTWPRKENAMITVTLNSLSAPPTTFLVVNNHWPMIMCLNWENSAQPLVTCSYDLKSTFSNVYFVALTVEQEQLSLAYPLFRTKSVVHRLAVGGSWSLFWLGQKSGSRCHPPPEWILLWETNSLPNGYPVKSFIPPIPSIYLIFLLLLLK